jgi:hypothetical protein
MSVSGQVLQSEKWETTGGSITKQVDISRFAKGIYYLKFVSNSNIFTEKIILQ